MRSLRSPFLFGLGLLLVLSVNAAAAQDTLNRTDAQGMKQGWWQIDAPKAGKPEYADGQKIEEGRYADNKRIGQWQRYWPNGKLMSVITYTMGRPKGEYRTYYPDGKPEEQGTWDLDRNIGSFKRWHPNGKVAQEFIFDRYGTRDGPQRYYYDNGQVAAEVTIKQGREEGELKRYYANGDVQQTARFAGGKIDANTSKIYPPATGSAIAMPAADAPLAPVKTDDESTNAMAFRPDGWNTLYDQQLRLAQQGEYRNGRLWNGKVYRYGKDGILFRIEVYAEGRYAGRAQITDEDKH